MKNKILKIGTALMTCAVLSVVPASAVTESYNWTFNSTSGNLPTNSGKKNDLEQNYYLTINGGNISSTNVFGARIRRASDNAAVSVYKTHKKYKTSKAYAYSSKVNKNTLYLMKGKKDDSSTSKAALNVKGRVTY